MTERLAIVRGIVHNDGDVLILQNTDGDDTPVARGKWEIPGGYVEEHDDHETAALKREIEEETGLDVTVERELPRVAVEEDGVVADCQYYLARAADRAVTLSDEHQDYAWIAPEDTDEFDWLHYAKYALIVLEQVADEL